MIRALARNAVVQNIKGHRTDSFSIGVNVIDRTVKGRPRQIGTVIVVAKRRIIGRIGVTGDVIVGKNSGMLLRGTNTLPFVQKIQNRPALRDTA